MENRYRFLNDAGNPQGPFWLGEMRRLWRTGEIHPETPVCQDGATEWDPARTYPEITDEMARLPLGGTPAANSPPRRGLSWGVWVLILLLALFMAWVQFWYLRE